MKDRFTAVACVAVLAFTAGCASTSPPSAKPVPKGEAVQQPARVSLFCNDKSVEARFDQFGIPQGEQIRGLAIGGDSAYVLFQPARLLRVTRKEGKIEAETALGKPGESWTSLDIDPLDGAVWIATDQLSLVRVSPDWKMSAVNVQKVEGKGGFEAVRAASDALYTAPACADTTVWRLDRAGKVLGTAFPSQPPGTDGAPVKPENLRCTTVRLERTPDGRIVAWDPRLKALRVSDGQGAWSEVPAGSDLAFFHAVEEATPDQSVAKGLAIGSRDEAWYVKAAPRSLFWWKGKPAFLGPLVNRNSGGADTLLLVPQGNGVKEIVETCHGTFLQAAATSGTHYAAVTLDSVILGDFAAAPDLP